MKKIINSLYYAVGSIILLAVIGFILFRIAGSRVTSRLHDRGFEIPADGSYQGISKVFGFKTVAYVDFTVNGNKVTSFEIKQLMTTPGYGIQDKIQEAVNESDNLDFDAISGATISSIFVKDAVLEALKDKEIE